MRVVRADVNRAVDHVRSGKVRFRAVLVNYAGSAATSAELSAAGTT